MNKIERDDGLKLCFEMLRMNTGKTSSLEGKYSARTGHLERF